MTRRRGGVALRRDVFDPLPGEGRWSHVLLVDGNIGIGGDPGVLLRRCAGLLRRGGTVLVEVDPPGAWAVARARVRRPATARAGRGPVFRWARVGCRRRTPNSPPLAGLVVRAVFERGCAGSPSWNGRDASASPRPEDFTGRTRRAVSARIGLWLGAGVRGVLPHRPGQPLLQHPPGWFTWPTRPVSLYRVTQGIHVLSGIAAIPLLLAKLWSVYPRLFARPPLRPPWRAIAHAAERLSILVLVAAAFFELVTGVFNVAQSYPWRFFFPAVHYAVAWVVVGALAVHVGVKLPVIRSALGERISADPPPNAARRRAGGRSCARRGQRRPRRTGHRRDDRPWLRRASLLASALRPTDRRACPSTGPRQRRAYAIADDWRLELVVAGRRTRVHARRAGRHCRSAPPPCRSPAWRAGARRPAGPACRVATCSTPPGRPPAGRSACPPSKRARRCTRRSTLPAAHARDPLTLLALRLNGEVLDPDHGYPCRIIAPNRPGVLQTKWVTRLEVLP